MAMLDVSALLKEQIRQGSQEARLENKVVLGMFSEGADKVSKGGVVDFMEGTARANKLETDKAISADDAKLIKAAFKRLMDAKLQYGEDFYKS